VRVATASKQPRPARDPHWLGCRRPRECAAEARRRAESLPRISLDSFEQDNDPKRSRCTVFRFAWFILDNTIGLLHGEGVVTVGEERSEQGRKELFVGLVDLLPDRVRNTTRARG